MPRSVAVVLYPGCVFFEIALATEVLARRMKVAYFTPDGTAHVASNGAQLSVSGSFITLIDTPHNAVLVPGGDPASILLPQNVVRQALYSQATGGALIAGICAGNLVMAASGLLQGRRGTHNYTVEHAPRENVAATAAIWKGMEFVRANLVQDGKFITAQPWAYRQYAAVVARELGVLGPHEADELVGYPSRAAYDDA